MANKSSTAKARKKSTRIANQSALESAAPQPVSPAGSQVIDSDASDAPRLVDNAGTADTIFAPDLSDGHSSDITPPPEYVKPKAKTKTKKRAPSEATLSGDSDNDKPPPRKKTKKTATGGEEDFSKRSACCKNLDSACTDCSGFRQNFYSTFLERLRSETNASSLHTPQLSLKL